MAQTKSRVKKTFNLDPETVQLVRSMVGPVAETQDAVVTRALRAMARQLRDRRHSDAWAQSAADPPFRQEAEEIARGFEADDRRAWETGG